MKTNDKNILNERNSQGQQKVSRIVLKFYFNDANSKGYDYIYNFEPSIGLYGVVLNGKVGFADEYGNLVIPPTYDLNYDSKGAKNYTGTKEYIFVKLNGLYGVIKHNGEVTVPFMWSDIVHYNGDIAAVCVLYRVYSKFEEIYKEKWGFINLRTGELLLKPCLDTMAPLSENLIEVFSEAKGKYALFDVEKGKLLTGFKYDSIESLINNYIPACIGDDWGLLDTKGNVVIKPKYAKPFYFKDDFAIVSRKYWKKEKDGDFEGYSLETKIVLLHISGTELINHQFDYWSTIRQISKGIFFVKLNTKEKRDAALLQYVELNDGNILEIKNATYLNTYILYDNEGNIKEIKSQIYLTMFQKEKKQNVIKVEFFKDLNLHYLCGGEFSIIGKSNKKIKLSTNEQKEFESFMLSKTMNFFKEQGIEDLEDLFNNG